MSWEKRTVVSSTVLQRALSDVQPNAVSNVYPYCIYTGCGWDDNRGSQYFLCYNKSSGLIDVVNKLIDCDEDDGIVAVKNSFENSVFCYERHEDDAGFFKPAESCSVEVKPLQGWLVVNLNAADKTVSRFVHTDEQKATKEAERLGRVISGSNMCVVPILAEQIIARLRVFSSTFEGYTLAEIKQWNLDLPQIQDSVVNCFDPCI